MRKHWKWLRLIGVGLWIYIVLHLDFAKIVDALRLMEPLWFLVAFVFLVGMFLFKAIRWRTVLNVQGVHYRLAKTVGITFVSAFFGLMMPGKMGDIIKVSYVKSSGLSVSRGLVSILLDRIYDILVLLLFCIFGLLYFSGMFAREVREIGSILFAIALLGVLIVLQRGRIYAGTKKLLKLVLSQSWYEMISQEWGAFKEEFVYVAGKTVLSMSLFSLLSYLCVFCQFFALARALGLSPSFLYLGLSLSLATVASLLPISIGGIGTREAVLIVMLGRVSISPESAVLLSFIDIVVFAVLLPALFIVPFWFNRWNQDGSLAP